MSVEAKAEQYEEQLALNPESTALQYLTNVSGPITGEEAQAAYWELMRHDSDNEIITNAAAIVCLSAVRQPRTFDAADLAERAVKLGAQQPVLVHYKQKEFLPVYADSGILERDTYLRILGWSGPAGLAWKLPLKDRSDIPLVSVNRHMTIGTNDITHEYSHFLEEQEFLEKISVRKSNERLALARRVAAAAAIAKIGLTTSTPEFLDEATELTDRITKLDRSVRSTPDYAGIIEASMAFSPDAVTAKANNLLNMNDRELIGKLPAIINFLTSANVLRFRSDESEYLNSEHIIVNTIRNELRAVADTSRNDYIGPR